MLELNPGLLQIYNDYSRSHQLMPKNRRHFVKRADAIYLEGKRGISMILSLFQINIGLPKLAKTLHCIVVKNNRAM
jgi:hypothetical protein